MPVPVWDCTDMSLLEEPLDSVLSDDIWKKFDLDEPLDAQYIYGHQTTGAYPGGASIVPTIDKAIGTTTTSAGSVHGSPNSNASTCHAINAAGGPYDEYASGQSVCLPEFYDKASCRESREIRHHDCMWAGLCISKEHNRTLPAKKDSLMNSKRVPAGRSLLISSRTSSNGQQAVNQQTTQQQQPQQSLYQQRRNNKDGLESDGDSARPETPQSSESEMEDDENEDEDDNDAEVNDNYAKDETCPRRITRINQEPRHPIKHEIIEDGPLIFKHDQISINEKLSECMGDEFGNSPVRSAPVSEVTGQLVRKFHQHQYPHHHHQNRHAHHRNHRSPNSPPPSASPCHQHHNSNHNHNNDHHHNSNHNHHHHHHHHQNTRIKIEAEHENYHQSTRIKIEDEHENYHQSTRIKIEDEHENYHRYDDSNDDQHHQEERIIKHEPDNWNTLNDHCYHQPSSKKLEHLGVQTPSDSEEEIDVVTFEKPCRPAALPTYPSIADQQHFQQTVKSALKESPAAAAAAAPRPRGRPPSSGTPRKRTATPSDGKPSKRPKHRTYLSRSKMTKNGPPTPASSPLKANSSPIGDTSRQAGTSRSSSSDDEPDTEKRSLHNNMERQRRIELRNAFEDLRLLVPAIENKEKAPKVAILRQAAIYCDMLTEIDRVTSARVIEMKRRQERLRARLSQLRRSLAMTR